MDRATLESPGSRRATRAGAQRRVRKRAVARRGPAAVPGRSERTCHPRDAVNIGQNCPPARRHEGATNRVRRNAVSTTESGHLPVLTAASLTGRALGTIRLLTRDAYYEGHVPGSSRVEGRGWSLSGAGRSYLSCHHAANNRVVDSDRSGSRSGRMGDGRRRQTSSSPVVSRGSCSANCPNVMFRRVIPGIAPASS